MDEGDDMKIGFHSEGIFTEAHVTIAAQTVFVDSFEVDDMQIDPTEDLIKALHNTLVRCGIVHNRIMTHRNIGEHDKTIGMGMN